METSVDQQVIVIRDHAKLRSISGVEPSCFDFQASSLDIYLICVCQGMSQLQTSFIPHPVELGTAEAIFLAFPKNDWSVKIHTEENTYLFVIEMQVSTFHKMINPSFNEHQLENTQRFSLRDLTKIIPVNPTLMICFDQLLHYKSTSPFGEIFQRAKFLEIFSLLLEASFGTRMEECPVAMSHAIELKLNQVRRHIIDHLDEIPDPDKLAVMYELPRNTLREGYRYKFGKTIHQFHADHKLESAMQMLNEGELLVKEIAFRIGYQNPSHFISAFKKRFGFTPKQYLKRQAV